MTSGLVVELSRRELAGVAREASITSAPDVASVLQSRASCVRLPFSARENIRNPAPLARLGQKAGVLGDPLVRRGAHSDRADLGDEPGKFIFHSARIAELEVPAQRVVRVGNKAVDAAGRVVLRS